MGQIRVRSHMVDIIFALALFGVFAVSALLVSITGARVYKSTAESMNINFETRACVTYVSTKIRQGDEAGSVMLDELSGIPALLLEQRIGGETYQTWIYHYQGALMEIFTAKGNEVDPDFGSVITEVETFSVTKAGENLYSVSSEDKNGNRAEVLVSTRTRAIAD